MSRRRPHRRSAIWAQGWWGSWCVGQVLGAAAAPTVLSQQPQSGLSLQQLPQTQLSRPGVPMLPARPALRLALELEAGGPERQPMQTAAPAPPPPGATPAFAARRAGPAAKLTTNAADQAWRPAAASVTPEQPAWQRELLVLLQHDEQQAAAEGLASLIEAHGPALLALQDADLDQRLGWAWMRAKQPAKAVDWFQATLALKPAAQGVQLGLALAWRDSGRPEKAYQTLAGANQNEAVALRGALALTLAQRAQLRADDAEQRLWLQRAVADGQADDGVRSQLAWLAYRLGDDRSAAEAFASLYAQHPDTATAQGLLSSLRRLGATQDIATLAVQGGPFAQLLHRDQAQALLNLGLSRAAAAVPDAGLAVLAGVSQPSLTLTASQRDKSGSSGSSQLTIRREPEFSLRLPQGEQAWQLTLAPVSLDAGTANAATPVGSAQVGQALPDTRLAAGWEPRLTWRLEGASAWSVALGTTPLSGPVPAALTGAVGWHSTASDHAAQVQLLRGPVRDSLLSYVGWQDPASGQAWGRVLRQGVAAQGYKSWAGWQWNGSLAWDALSGQQVASNQHAGLSVGASQDFAPAGWRYLSMGPSLAYEHYARDLSHFTWGQGGYFSPQQFVSLGGNLAFQTPDAARGVLRGRLGTGWQSVEQQGGACFVLAPPATGAQTLCNAAFAASRSQGLASTAELAGAYLLSPQWELSGNLAWRSGPAYRDRVLSIGLRYYFEGRWALFGEDLPDAPARLW